MKNKALFITCLLLWICVSTPSLKAQTRHSFTLSVCAGNAMDVKYGMVENGLIDVRQAPLVNWIDQWDGKWSSSVSPLIKGSLSSMISEKISLGLSVSYGTGELTYLDEEFNLDFFSIGVAILPFPTIDIISHYSISYNRVNASFSGSYYYVGEGPFRIYSGIKFGLNQINYRKTDHLLGSGESREEIEQGVSWHLDMLGFDLLVSKHLILNSEWSLGQPSWFSVGLKVPFR